MKTRSLALGMLAAAMTACGPPGGGELRLSGVVQGTPIVVRAAVAGQIVEAAFAEGREVRRDDPLAALDPTATLAKIKLLEDQIAVMESRAKCSRALAELEVQGAGEAREDAAARLRIAATQRDRARKTVDEYDRNPPYVQRRVEAGRVIEERDQIGRLQAEWADARLSFFELQMSAAETAVHQAAVAGRSAQLRAESDVLAAELLEQRHRLEEARRVLEDHTIRAAADGVVSVKVRSAGEIVREGDAIAVLIDPTKLWVGVTVEESLAGEIREGDTLEAELPDNRRLPVTVESVSAAAGFAVQRDVDRVRRDIRAFRLKLDLPNDPAARPGMTAYVHINE